MTTDKQIWVTFATGKHGTSSYKEDTRLYFEDESTEIKAHLRSLGATGEKWRITDRRAYTAPLPKQIGQSVDFATVSNIPETVTIARSDWDAIQAIYQTLTNLFSHYPS